MAKVFVSDTHLTNIANAIRTKNGTNTTYEPAEMAETIEEIETECHGPIKFKIIPSDHQTISVKMSSNANQTTFCSDYSENQSFTFDPGGFWARAYITADQGYRKGDLSDGTNYWTNGSSRWINWANPKTYTFSATPATELVYNGTLTVTLTQDGGTYELDDIVRLNYEFLAIGGAVHGATYEWELDEEVFTIPDLDENETTEYEIEHIITEDDILRGSINFNLISNNNTVPVTVEDPISLAAPHGELEISRTDYDTSSGFVAIDVYNPGNLTLSSVVVRCENYNGTYEEQTFENIVPYDGICAEFENMVGNYWTVTITAQSPDPNNPIVTISDSFGSIK